MTTATIKRNRKAQTAALLAAIAGIGFGAQSNALSLWDGGGDGVNWSDPLNWSGDTLPGPADLVFNNGNNGVVLGTVTLDINASIDALRFAEGRDLNHTAGTLTVGAGAGDTESSFQEFGDTNPDGNATSTYTMSGTAKYESVETDPGALFILGRAGSNKSQLFMSGSSVMTAPHELWFGMDSEFEGVISGNAKIETTNEASVQIARFVSPNSSLTFQDSASLQVDGFFVMSDFAGADGTGGSGDSLLKLVGSSLDIDIDGLFMRQNATLEFVADAGGISTIDLGGDSELMDNRFILDDPNPPIPNPGMDPQLVVDLSALSGLARVTLIDKTTPGTITGQFRGLDQGDVVPGAGGRVISYIGGDGNDVVLWLPGDFDGDGDVDGVDVATMFANFNGPGGGVPAGDPHTDLDNDGDADGVDVASLFGKFTGPLAPASVPEPTSLALLGLGGLLVARRRRA